MNMWETYQQNQSELQLLMNEEKRLVRKMESLKQEILDYSSKRNELERQLTKEQQDVTKLDGFSFANMVKNWRGNLDEIRRQEAASVEIDGC
jgi:chromosome segregation ATPase